MSEFSFDGFGDKPLRMGPEMVLLDPFTPNERVAMADSPEARAIVANRPEAWAQFVVAKVDHETKTVTLTLSDREDGALS